MLAGWLVLVVGQSGGTASVARTPPRLVGFLPHDLAHTIIGDVLVEYRWSEAGWQQLKVSENSEPEYHLAANMPHP